MEGAIDFEVGGEQREEGALSARTQRGDKEQEAGGGGGPDNGTPDNMANNGAGRKYSVLGGPAGVTLGIFGQTAGLGICDSMECVVWRAVPMPLPST